MVQIDVRLDTGALAIAFRERSKKAVADRADRLGVRGANQMRIWIDAELGKSQPRKTPRPGIISMREIDWQHTVNSGGELPFDVSVFCTNVIGPMVPKFWALNSGRQGNYTVTAPGKGLPIPSDDDDAKGGVVVRKSATVGAAAGHHWVERLPVWLSATANAGFIGSKRFNTGRGRRR